MLKRYQILMDDWLADYFKFIAEKFDFSFSEMIRLSLCKHIIDVTPIVFPKYKIKLDEKIFRNIAKNRDIVGSIDTEEHHRFISTLYFEAQKIMEMWMEEDKVHIPKKRKAKSRKPKKT